MGIFDVIGHRLDHESMINNGMPQPSVIVTVDEMRQLERAAGKSGLEFLRLIYKGKTLMLRLSLLEVGTNKASGEGRFGYGFKAAPERTTAHKWTSTDSAFVPPKVEFDFGKYEAGQSWNDFMRATSVTEEDLKRAAKEAPGFKAHPPVDPYKDATDALRYAWNVTEGRPASTAPAPEEEVHKSWRRMEDIIGSDPFMNDDLRKIVEETLRKAAGLK